MNVARTVLRRLVHTPTPSMTTSASPSLRNLVPPQHKGMTVLDRAQFDLTIPVLAAKVKAGEMGNVRKHDLLRGCVWLPSLLTWHCTNAPPRHIVDIPKIRSITPDADPSLRRLLLRVAKPEDLPADTRTYLTEQGITLEPDSVTLGYDHWTASGYSYASPTSAANAHAQARS